MKGKEKKVNIVIADDNLKDQQLLKTALLHSGLRYECSCVYNGLQLMDFLTQSNSYKDKSEETPEIIFLDIAMPFMNGFGVLLMMRQDPRLSQIPVYVISGVTKTDMMRTTELGAKDVLPSLPRWRVTMK
jgi:CheY-like chemotaxis protein